ncbi:hypothetical protein DES53_101275 [Roseimicrobium gellanilyticum]|uniref:Uncharacterized protein n=1 Tax=Roseimicrobium gellanilyticum TaxID=748857 RepID=A0A366HW11_9BACT|nr:hypothetical protein [Roseimicrobium gellanilyticum]RBP47478.1 hypothetical protein DES53_101275 [Roseimicrobium gellanilyticum]
MKKWTVINGIILHCVTSGLWALGFGGMMTAFNKAEGVSFGKVIFFLHNLFYFPIVLLEYFGLRVTPRGLMRRETFFETMIGGTIGPFPSLATLAWCFVMGYLLYSFLHRRNRIEN